LAWKEFQRRLLKLITNVRGAGKGVYLCALCVTSLTSTPGIIAGFYQAEAERRAATGNPGPGANNNQGGPKKPKFESPADIKKRLAEHKARKAEQAANGTSGGNTPMADTPIADSPGAFVCAPSCI
jgi:hypothetical protein